MKFCPMCGHALSAGVRFCVSCGHQLPTVEAPHGESDSASGRSVAPPVPSSAITLAYRAMAKEKAIRKPARRTIVESVNIRAMLTCAARAQASGDSVDAEFWWIEVATARAPAGDDVIASGVVGLCERVLIPQGRFEEAELYSRHLLTRHSLRVRSEGQAIIRAIDAERARRGVTRLVHSEAWRGIATSGPGVYSVDQQSHYDRYYAFLELNREQGSLNDFLEQTSADFLPSVTGWMIGASKSDAVAALGIERDTMAKALADWLTDQRILSLGPS